MSSISEQIAGELQVRAAQVRAAVDLLDGGATVPFVARYRKEATGGLDDAQLRRLQERLAYLRELAERRGAVLKSIEGQGKLTPVLRAAIEATPTKQELEDLYLPYKPKRRTKGQIAREFGIEPLADRLWADSALDPAAQALAFVRAETGEGGEDFTTVPAVLDGVRDILSERWAEDAALVQSLRGWLWAEGLLQSKLVTGKNGDDPENAKFRDYFDYAEPVSRVPSHRALAALRGRQLEILEVKLAQPQTGQEPEGQGAVASLAEGRIARHLGWSHQGRAADDLLRKCVAWAWRVKLSLSTERDLLARLREQAEQVAIQVFADNLRDLLLAAPAGARAVLGLDPGIRTGVKAAVVDATGKLLATATVYPHEPRRDWEGALRTLAALVARHGVQLIAIGNGTASRETDKLAGDLIKLMQKQAKTQNVSGQIAIEKIVISEAGASVYSASEYASQELPELDVSLRGAVSIARRLQDPLAELVKIDPKSIGVGQYQHDVNQSALARTLDAVVEDCVNRVGADLNTASVPLLARVSGLTPAVAQTLVRWREAHGAFGNRRQLLQVSGLGPKTFEQSAGFLRIRDGDNPLDMTGVHPETYPVVEQIILKTGQPIEQLMGRAELLRPLKPEQFADARFGPVTVRDILLELEKPGRDPRPGFQVARFNEDVQDIADLQPGMVLQGTVSNVAQFGAFVDLGVHQDGLVHVSQLARKFVADAREIVKTGQIVKVKVLEVDAPRKRITLSMKLDAPLDAAGAPARAPRASRPQRPAPTAMASAFAKLKGGR
ncbi:MAG: RNA-binding transcriptional accessory protein [Burkholderiaceae bacterium]|jgi:uncharacterized protein|nr:RNA-binding transcriptional accessory protein [Burkholderiaceae bacterium]